MEYPSLSSVSIFLSSTNTRTVPSSGIKLSIGTNFPSSSRNIVFISVTSGLPMKKYLFRAKSISLYSVKSSIEVPVALADAC